MPETANRLKASYPDNGWSSWFGAYFGTDYPSAMPYGVVIRAPGSTGIFTPFNSVHGVKFAMQVTNPPTDITYESSFQPPISVLPAFVTISLNAPGSTKFSITWYIEGGLPPFIYAQITNAFWSNTRAAITIPGPGPPPLPLLSRVGDLVTITPWNKRGFELIP